MQQAAYNVSTQRINWPEIEVQLSEQGFAIVPALLTVADCNGLRELYINKEIFRSRIIMSRHNFGRGEYQYFNYPLPQLVADLRQALYPNLAVIANRWNQIMKIAQLYPATLEAMLATCHQQGQLRPTPLLLKYQQGDYNCLHQDLYGEYFFPLQVAILLSQPHVDFTGGEFVIVEQRPRMQSKVMVVPLYQGDAVIFVVNHRPVQGTRGFYRVNMRHGVSQITHGQRYTAGIIFHDAT